MSTFTSFNFFNNKSNKPDASTFMQEAFNKYRPQTQQKKKNNDQVALDMVQYFAQLPTKVKLKSVPISVTTLILKTNSEFFITKYKELPKKNDSFLQKLADPINLK